MLRTKLVKNVASGVGHISNVILVAYLIMGLSRPAFATEPVAAPDEQPHLQLAPIYFSHSVGGNFGYMYQRNTYGPIATVQQTASLGVKASIGVRSF